MDQSPENLRKSKLISGLIVETFWKIGKFDFSTQSIGEVCYCCFISEEECKEMQKLEPEAKRSKSESKLKSKPKPGFNHYLGIVIAFVLFAAGVPFFIFFAPSSFLFEIGGFMMLTSLLAFVAGLKTMQTRS